ncbi:MAG: MFS transporter, partial [Clostridia bacterium]
NFAKFSIYMLISGIGMAIAFLTYPFLAKKVGKKPLFVASSLMCIVGYALMFAANIVFHGNIVILSVASLPSILGLGYINVSRMTMISNVCDYSEIKIGKRFETIWVSIISFVNKASSAIVAFCIGIALDVAGISGLDPSTDSAVISAMGINVIRILMFIIPIVLVSLGLVTYLSFYKLDNPGYLDKIKRKQKINSKEN